MKISPGNEKLGDNCYVVSRPVGDTCPLTCYFLHNGCYAEKTEKRFPNARKAGFNNITVTKQEIIDLLKKAEKDNCSIRLHERGDFGLNDKVDIDYITAWKKALHEYPTNTKIWAYTHFLHRRVADLQNYGINLYASVHNEKDVNKAMKCGFSLFAYIIKDKKKKGGSLDHPKSYNLPILGNTLLCPEMRFGRKGDKKNVTCTGTQDSIACKMCTNGLKNVVFLTH